MITTLSLSRCPSASVQQPKWVQMRTDVQKILDRGSTIRLRFGQKVYSPNSAQNIIHIPIHYKKELKNPTVFFPA